MLFRDRAPVPSLIRMPGSMLGLFVGLASTLAGAAPTALDPEIRNYLETHCIKCHDEDTEKGDFRVDNLSPKIGLEDTPQWLELMERISSGEMPPKKEKKQPTPAESAKFVEMLAQRMKEGESARLAARGKVSYNRLSRDEYVNTVRDLMGVHFDATDPGGFLEDAEWHGFERIGSVMTLSPSNVEKYMAAAEVILSEAYPEKRPLLMDATKRAVGENNVNERYREEMRARGLLDKLRYEVWPGDIFRNGGPQDPLPEAGIYEITYTLSGLKPEKDRAPRLFVYETKLDRVLHEQDIIAAEDKPMTVTFRTHLPKGRPSIHVINSVPGPSNTPPSGRHGQRPFISTKEGRSPWQMKLTDEQGRPRYPFLIMDTVSWRGPIITDQEQKRRDEYMPTEAGDLAKVREGLSRMARRAFRRPVTTEELDGYVGIVQAELKAGEKFHEAVKAGMLSILCSKSFLFVTEGDEETMRHELNAWEIASRLSYMLWSTMPDDELMDLAEKGALNDKAVLRTQVARMLADPRAVRFTDSFSSQWLHLRKVGRFPPDKKLYPDYDAHLEKSMVGETRAFFRQVLNEGLTLREFLNSDWTMMNSRLAKFYGVPENGPAHEDFRKVSLPGEARRGGLLTQASVLSLTSDGTRHRPVHRGVWLSEAIFGKTPPPPPANVDPIAPNPVDAPKATLRMKLEAHIHDASCAACHAKIDPLGLAFENYDAIGRWRTVEEVEGTGDNPTVNASGKLPDGRTYATPEEFKTLLLSNIDTFNHTFIEKLATYGMRRSMSFDDRKALHDIAAASKEKDYRLRDIIEAFVCSDLFAKR